MNTALGQVAERRVDEAMAGEGGKADEARRAYDDMEVPAFTGSGMAGMQRAVITDFEQVGIERRLQTLPNCFAAAHGGHAFGSPSRTLRRLSQRVCAITKTRVTPVMP